MGRLRDLFLIFGMRKYYVMEVKQRLQQLTTEFEIIKAHVEGKESLQISTEEKYIIERVKSLLGEAENQKDYKNTWAMIGDIELMLISLMDIASLRSAANKLQSDLYLLHEEDRKLWVDSLNQIVKNEPPLEVGSIRAILRTITLKIAEARRTEFMTVYLKRALLTRFILVTIVIGGLVATLFAVLLQDINIWVAISVGTLGGFFSRVLALRDLNYKPAAYPIMALYNYVQALLGGIGALVLYIILISPLGSEVISDKFYVPSKSVETWRTPNPKIGPLTVPFVDSTNVNFFRRSVQFPQPSMLIVLSFFAGFSERWLLGTLENIVGKKLAKNGEKGTDVKQPKQ